MSYLEEETNRLILFNMLFRDKLGRACVFTDTQGVCVHRIDLN